MIGLSETMLAVTGLHNAAPVQAAYIRCQTYEALLLDARPACCPGCGGHLYAAVRQIRFKLLQAG